MRQSDRRKILWFLVFLFIVAGIGVISYAQGYRLSVSPWGIQKIGAIYVKSFPGNAQIYLDGKQIGQSFRFGTSFLFLQGGTLINNLFPKKYSLALKASGYRDWQQTLEVKPSLVAEAKYAVLVPQDPKVVSTTSFSGFWLAGNDLITQNAAKTLNFGNKTLSGSKVLDETPDGKVLTSDNLGNIFESNLNTGHSLNASVLLTIYGLNADNFTKETLDKNGNNLFFQNDRSVYMLNLDSGVPTGILRTASSAAVSSLASSPNLIAVSEYNALKNSSAIFVYNKGSGATSTYPLSLAGRTIQMDFNNGRLGLVQSDGSFWYGDPRSANGLADLASDALGFSFSDNLNLAAVYERSALEIIPLAGNSDDYARFAPPDPSQIKNVFWYSDGYHLFLSYPGQTLFLDTNDPKLEHLYQVGAPGAEYMPSSNELYFLDNGVLKKLSFPS